mmetsp:Transcript_136589/g.240818  ORF Transcript_136589/g.240818 Transcript_136589/m.240818 type:complete len:527 (+) Transcript_136589:56-1636(+)
MRSPGFFCPSFSNIFRPSAAPGPRSGSGSSGNSTTGPSVARSPGPSRTTTAGPGLPGRRMSGTPPAQGQGSGMDLAILEVAWAIYHTGQADGVPGLEAVAHVIQNRMNNPSFPGDAQGVVAAGRGQFLVDSTQAVPRRSPGAESQLFDHTKRLAAQLVHPPHRLSSPDPTGGMLYRDMRGLSANVGMASGSNPTTASRSFPFYEDQVEAPVAREYSSDSDEQFVVPPTSPPPVHPSRSRRSFAFVRDRSAVGISMVRRRGAGESASTPAGGSSEMPIGSASSSGAGPGIGSTRAGIASSSGSLPSTPAANTGAITPHTAPPGEREHPPMGASTPPPMAPRLSTSHPISALAAAPGPGPPIGTSSRLLARPSHPGRPGRSSTSPRPGRLGPVQTDGFHDMILPCGLFQEEVIELMYRDLSPEDFEKLSKLDERLPKRNTAHRNLVDRLPRMHAKDCNATECRVCLAELEPNAIVVKLPCSHAFHPACISKWLTQCKNTCPLCSAPIETAIGATHAPTVAAHSSTRAL